jgi:histidinol phosphatase-like PHP family hydrolase
MAIAKSTYLSGSYIGFRKSLILEFSMVFEYDYHTHTKRSYCHEGDLTIDNLIKMAKVKGIKGFTITDHAHHQYFDGRSAWQYKYILDYNLFLDVMEIGDASFENYLEMIEEHREKLQQNGDDLKLLVGTEADVAKNGKLVFNQKYRDRLDILIGGIHWLPCVSNGLSPKAMLVEFMDYTMMLLENNLDILAHPTRMFKAHKMEVPREVARPIILKAKEANIALEINSHNYPDPDIYFIKMCIDEGVKLSLGTDTHRIVEFGDFSMQKRILKEAGVSEDKFDEIIFRHEKFS